MEPKAINPSNHKGFVKVIIIGITLMVGFYIFQTVYETPETQTDCPVNIAYQENRLMLSKPGFHLLKKWPFVVIIKTNECKVAVENEWTYDLYRFNPILIYPDHVGVLKSRMSGKVVTGTLPPGKYYIDLDFYEVHHIMTKKQTGILAIT